MKQIISCISLHLKRCLPWRLVEVEPTPDEETKLTAEGNDSEVLRSYLAWRRSVMFVSLPVMISGAITGFVEVGDYFRNDASYNTNGLADFVLNLPNFAQTVLLLAVIGVLIKWSKWRISSKVLKFGWLISFVMPLIPAAFPLEYLLSNTGESEFIQDCRFQGYSYKDCEKYYQASMMTSKMTMAISYAITILPVLITFPSSASRGALRIRGLLPDSSLTSWVLTISVPFQSLLILAALVVIVQLAGGPLLIVGALILVAAPWLYILRRKLYVGVPTEKTEKQVDRNQKIMLGLNIVALLLILVWATTEHMGYVPLGNGENSIIKYDTFFRLLFEGIGRLLVTTVVFTDALLRMTVTNWRNDRSRRQDESNCERIDSLFESLESNISREPKGENDTSSASSDESKEGAGSSDVDEEAGTSASQEETENAAMTAVVGVAVTMEDGTIIKEGANSSDLDEETGTYPSPEKTESVSMATVVRETVTMEDGTILVTETTTYPDGTVTTTPPSMGPDIEVPNEEQSCVYDVKL